MFHNMKVCSTSLNLEFYTKKGRLDLHSRADEGLRHYQRGPSSEAVLDVKATRHINCCAASSDCSVHLLKGTRPLQRTNHAGKQSGRKSPLHTRDNWEATVSRTDDGRAECP